MTRQGRRLLWAGALSVTAALLLAPRATQARRMDAAPSQQAELPPNYALASRFMPAELKQLVFDTAVTPHWFTHSDRFWFSYQTPKGTDYYWVDPGSGTRKPLWDNVRMAEQLSIQTGLAYDAQHLGIQDPRLAESDTAIRFYVEIRADAVLPGTEDADRPQVLKGPVSRKPRKLYFTYTLATGRLERLDDYKRRVQPLWANISPDGQAVLFARGDNLYSMDRENYAKALADPADPGIVEAQLTTDGMPKDSYAAPVVPELAAALKKQDRGDAENPKGMRRPTLPIEWSQDNAKFALVREDDRKVPDLWTIHNLARPRPQLQTYSYAMPGEANTPVEQVEIFTLATHKRIIVPESDFPLVQPTIELAEAPPTSAEREEEAQRQLDSGALKLKGFPTYSGNARWVASGSDKLYFVVTDRDFRSADAGVIDTATGRVTILVRETSNQFLNLRVRVFFKGVGLRLVNNGQDLVWWSERDGWAHYYLYSARTGELLHPITSGPWMSNTIVGVDQKAGALYFMGGARPGGRDSGVNPYYRHLYRVGLDGSGLTDLTPGNFDDQVEASDDAHYFAVTYSRVDTAPVSVLVNGRGEKLAQLAETDVSRLLAAGYQYPKLFTVKAADGITDLYGVMYTPFDMQPGRKYPVIEYVYPGPQTESVPTTFNPSDADNLPLAQLGFVVVFVGSRGGSPLRDKWYDTYGYGNMRDYGLADKRQAIIELADEYPFIDPGKVGIWGHSGGGFMTAAAMLQYPTFYTAGWSESGNHDNDNYNRAWSENYDGVREQEGANGAIRFIYTIERNASLAANLRGHLMLTTGDMDDNVNLANTMQLASALMRADKRFEMLVFPGMRHPYTPLASYVLVRRMDFFARWLLGASDTNPDILLLQDEKQHSPSDQFVE
ncbi:MAG TPA: DPP IV N-terminal domain-containing protein [Steroidobacteraceae bacterium]|nr:DPP IV N-terminal domain-containing protein [Steroidobacteraceae bacterium]